MREEKNTLNLKEAVDTKLDALIEVLNELLVNDNVRL